MQINKIDFSPSFSSKVYVSQNTLGAISQSKNGFARQVKQIRKLERNGANDIVEILGSSIHRINKDGILYPDSIMELSVIKKVGERLFRGTAIASYMYKSDSEPQLKQTDYERKYDFYTPDILKLYEEAKNNMEEIVVIPSLQKYI